MAENAAGLLKTELLFMPENAPPLKRATFPPGEIQIALTSLASVKIMDPSPRYQLLVRSKVMPLPSFSTVAATMLVLPEPTTPVVIPETTKETNVELE